MFWANLDAKEKLTVYVFTKEKEPISQSVISYLQTLQERYEFNYKEYIIWSEDWKEDKFNRDLADKVAEKFNEEIIGAPYIVIGSNYTFDEYEEAMNEEIANAIEEEIANNEYQDIVIESLKEVENQQKINNILTYVILLGLPLIVGSLIIISKKATKNKD